MAGCRGFRWRFSCEQLRPAMVLGVLILLEATLAVGGGRAMAADEPLPEKLRTRIERSRESANRENGVQLKATVEVRETNGEAEILLHWAIDYDGPRPPLVILKPTLEPALSAQCAVIFYPFWADGKDYPVPSHWPTPDKSAQIGKEHFLTLRAGEVGRGTLRVMASRLREELRKRWPDQLVKSAPPWLYVRLHHDPTVRGERHDLDAWTGSLQTELITVPLAKIKLQ